MLKLSDFDYNLPKELIAQYPSEKRDESRLLVLYRVTGKIEHRVFKDIVEYFDKGDLLVLNNTKVVPAKLVGKKETGGKVEILVLNPSTYPLPLGERERVRGEYETLLKPARGCKVGTRLVFGNGELEAEVSKIENSRIFLRFQCNGDFGELLNRFGKMPLPPYIKRDVIVSDRERYQTVYATKKGAVAAPTAGLHFTKEILDRISNKGVDIEYITLHVGYGTFRPVRCDDITKHEMEDEHFEIEGKVVEKIKDRKGRAIAVGTTTTRVLETFFKYGRQTDQRANWLTGKRANGQRMHSGWTGLFIYPPYKFNAVNLLLTNFHLPRTTLLMLVSAFCGRELLLDTYHEAIRQKYRFYSYGDAMLII